MINIQQKIMTNYFRYFKIHFGDEVMSKNLNKAISEEGIRELENIIIGRVSLLFFI